MIARSRVSLRPALAAAATALAVSACASGGGAAQGRVASLESCESRPSPPPTMAVQSPSERTVTKTSPSTIASLPDAELADVGAELDPDAVPVASVTPVAPTAAEPGAPTATSPSTDVRSWARAELNRAAAALAVRDYARARAIIATVKAKATGLAEAREADKGEVAIYNLRKLDRNPADSSTRARAQFDLRNTVWSSLFA